MNTSPKQYNKQNTKEVKSKVIQDRPLRKGPQGIKYTEEYLDEVAAYMETYIKDTPIPFIEDFTVGLKRYIPSNYITGVLDRSDKLLNAYKKLKDKQQSSLIKLALGDKINATMAIFTLKNVAGWKNYIDSTEEKTIHVDNDINDKLSKKDKKQIDGLLCEAIERQNAGESGAMVSYVQED